MLTGGQIRAARSLLRWTAKQTADRAGVSLPTIHRMEQQDGIPGGRAQTLAALQSALEAAGIEFIGGPDDGPGVRIWRDGKC